MTPRRLITIVTRGGISWGAKRIRSLKSQCYPCTMDTDMSKLSKNEVLAKLRRHYRQANAEYKRRLIDEAVSLLGYHRKSAIRALRAVPSKSPRESKRTGRPVLFASAELLPALRRIWLAAHQPCGRRLAALLPDWLPFYATHHGALAASVQASLLQASPATLERLLTPLRLQHRAIHRGGTRPGTLLRRQIPISGCVWDESRPGFLEIDTVALCGGSLEGDFIWILDATDLLTAWTELRSVWNKGAEPTLAQLRRIEASLPFPLRGLDFDNGGEFINHHFIRYATGRPSPIRLTRSRPYHKNDNAHVEGKNWTHVRQWLGYERYDNVAVLMHLDDFLPNRLSPFLNFFFPSMRLIAKERVGDRIHRKYDKPRTPYCRVLECPDIPQAQKDKLRERRSRLDPFELRARIDKDLRALEKLRLNPPFTRPGAFPYHLVYPHIPKT